MKLMKLLFGMWLALSAAELLAQKTLVTAKGSDFAPGLAKSWSKAGEGKLVLVLDTSKEVSRGKKLTAEIVKSNIEEKLKSSHGAAVTVSGPGKVEIAYKGAEKDFLTQLSKLRIRPASDIKLAAAGTVSDTGIRAKIAARNPTDGEVKVKVLNGTASKMQALVVEVGPSGVPAEIKANGTIWISGISDASIVGKMTIVKVGEAKDGVWSVSEAAK
jgi:hypothetical protein